MHMIKLLENSIKHKSITITVSVRLTYEVIYKKETVLRPGSDRSNTIRMRITCKDKHGRFRGVHFKSFPTPMGIAQPAPVNDSCSFNCKPPTSDGGHEAALGTVTLTYGISVVRRKLIF